MGSIKTPAELAKQSAYMRDYYQKNMERMKAAGKLRIQRPDIKLRRKIASDRRRQKGRDYANSVKLASGCIDCGYNENPVALQFDHVRGEKKIEVAKLIANRAGLEDIKIEIDKCVVRCANCHAIKTWGKLESS